MLCVGMRACVCWHLSLERWKISISRHLSHPRHIQVGRNVLVLQIYIGSNIDFISSFIINYIAPKPSVIAIRNHKKFSCLRHESISVQIQFFQQFGMRITFIVNDFFQELHIFLGQLTLFGTFDDRGDVSSRWFPFVRNARIFQFDFVQRRFGHLVQTALDYFTVWRMHLLDQWNILINVNTFLAEKNLQRKNRRIQFT